MFISSSCRTLLCEKLRLSHSNFLIYFTDMRIMAAMRSSVSQYFTLRDCLISVGYLLFRFLKWTICINKGNISLMLISKLHTLTVNATSGVVVEAEYWLGLLIRSGQNQSNPFHLVGVYIIFNCWFHYEWKYRVWFVCLFIRAAGGLRKCRIDFPLGLADMCCLRWLHWIVRVIRIFGCNVR